jgi:hypothetical protein
MLMGFLLTAIGFLLLVTSLGGIAIGVYMALDKSTRRRGQLFAIVWVPAVAASSGVMMHDVVTFTVGLVCFLIAGTVFVLQGDQPYEPPADTRADPARDPAGDRFLASEKTTKENKTRSRGRIAS